MQKNIFVKLQKIKGINQPTILEVKKQMGINTKKLKQFIAPYATILDLKKILRLKKTSNILSTITKKRIQLQVNIRSYKGLRHKNNYPVRGQRTHTNAKTQKKLGTRY